MRNYKVNSDQAGQRLDIFLVSKIPSLSRASIQKLLDQNKVLVNGSLPKASYHLKLSDKVRIDYNATSEQQVPSVDLKILYEDQDCLVIEKPTGLLSHSKGSFNPEATVASFLNEHINPQDWQTEQGPSTSNRTGIAHRLDRATSGVMIVAKTPQALAWLQKQFSLRKVQKVYYAVVSGQPEPQEAIIDMPIERNPKSPQTFRTGLNGKPAQTLYSVELSKNSYSLLRLEPKTGRTHQLRVHLKQLGYPIVGDTLYGGKAASRLYLHAAELTLTLPNKQRKTFTSSLPSKFKQLKEL